MENASVKTPVIVPIGIVVRAKMKFVVKILKCAQHDKELGKRLVGNNNNSNRNFDLFT